MLTVSRWCLLQSADGKQLIKSLRQLKVYSSWKFLQEFHREIRHAQDLTACLQKLINMGRQKEFQAVGDRALHAQLITLLRLKSWCEDKPQTHSTIHETARETGIHHSSAYRIIRIALIVTIWWLTRSVAIRRESVHLTWLYCTVQNMKPFRHGSRVWQYSGATCLINTKRKVRNLPN